MMKGLRRRLVRVSDTRVLGSPWTDPRFPGNEEDGAIEFGIPVLRITHPAWPSWLEAVGLDNEAIQAKFRREGTRHVLKHQARAQAQASRKGFRVKRGSQTRQGRLNPSAVAEIADSSIDAVVDGMDDGEIAAWVEHNMLNRLKPGIAEILVGVAVELSGTDWSGHIRNFSDTESDQSYTFENCLRLLEYEGRVVYDGSGDHFCVAEEDWANLDTEHPAAVAFKTTNQVETFSGTLPDDDGFEIQVPPAPIDYTDDSDMDGTEAWPYSHETLGDAFAQLILHGARQIDLFVPEAKAADLGSTLASSDAASSHSDLEESDR